MAELTEPVLPRTVTEAVEEMIRSYAETLNDSPSLLVHVAMARKLARRVDHEMDGSKLAALVIRLRQAVETLGVAATDTDEFDEIAARRREHEANGFANRADADDHGTGTGA